MGATKTRTGCPAVRALLALVALGTLAALASFAVWHLQRTSFWYDESMQFWMSMGGDGFDPPLAPRGSAMKALRSNAWGNLDPGGFTLVLRAWMALLGEGAVWQRALPLALFVVGMAALGALGWTWRRSVPFAVLSALLPAGFPLLLDYATEVRAYAMEFAGICLGALVIARFLDRPTIGRAMTAGLVFGVFLSSRYSYVLFTVGACACLIFAAATWRSGNRRALMVPGIAFAAPMLMLGGFVAAYPVRWQYDLRISPEGGAFLRYLDAMRATGRPVGDLLTDAAGNLLAPVALPGTVLAAIGAVVLFRALRHRRRDLRWPAMQTGAFGVLALAVLAATIVAWPWHPWQVEAKWSLYLQALSAIALVRFGASGLSLAGDPAENGAERNWRVGAVLLVGALVLDARLALHHRSDESTVVDALAYLDEHAPLPGGVAVVGHWYPTVRYFYEYGRFRGSSLYPSAYATHYKRDGSSPIESGTRFVISTVPLDALRTMEPGVHFVDDPSLPQFLYRIEPAANDDGGAGDR